MVELAINGGEPVRRRTFAQFPAFDERELSALKEVLESGVWGGYNPKVKEFERVFAGFQGANSGSRR